MIDLHCHILPGVDDGPVNVDFSLALARAAVSAGTDVIVATPHIRWDFPLDPASVRPRVRELNRALADAGIELTVLAAGEVAFTELDRLDDDMLGRLCLGAGPYILIETPYTADHGFEPAVVELGRRGFTPVLAHPERCPLFQREPAVLRRLVEAGVLCSITAASIVGRFGRTAREVATAMVEEGLVHNIASDAHDHLHRPPDLNVAFEGAQRRAPALAVQAAWLTVDAPRAILAGSELPPRPASRRGRPGRWRRLTGRGR